MSIQSRELFVNITDMQEFYIITAEKITKTPPFVVRFLPQTVLIRGISLTFGS